MLIQETQGFDFGAFVGKLTESIMAERQADRMHDLMKWENDARKIVANGETYNAPLSINPLGNVGMMVAVAALVVGAVLLVKS